MVKNPPCCAKAASASAASMPAASVPAVFHLKSPRHCTHEPGFFDHHAGAARQPGGAVGDGGVAAHLTGELDGDLRQGVQPAWAAPGQRGVRARLLVGQEPLDLFTSATGKTDNSPMERIFASGMREFLKLRERRQEASIQLDGAPRAMRASLQRELDVIEGNVGFLASVGSVSPYVGLFGTVWGIMHAFVGLANVQ